MTSYEDAINWICTTKETAASWPLGHNSKTVRNNIAKNRDAKAIADSFSYQVEMVLQQAKSNEGREMLQSEYNQLQGLLDRRKDCLDLLNDVTKMEDLFSMLSSDINNTAVDLSKKSKDNTNELPDNSALSPSLSLNCMQSLQDSWDYLQSLAKCSQIHLQNAANYHQFWHEVEESNSCLQYLLSEVPTKFNPKYLSSQPSHQMKLSLETILQTLKEYLQWQTRLDILYEKSKLVVPVPARREKLKGPISVQVLTNYSTDEFVLEEGSTVTLVDNSDLKKWRIRITNEVGSLLSAKEVIVPAIILLIPPTESSALDASTRLRLQMVAIWSAASRRLGPHLTKILLYVFKEWDESEAAKGHGITAEQKSSLISTLGLMDRTLGLTEKDNPEYQKLKSKTNQIVRSTKLYDPKEGGYKSTVIVQVELIRRLLQRYSDFLTYFDAYRGVMEDLRQPKSIFLYNRFNKNQYITTAHFIKNWQCDLEDERHWATSGEQMESLVEVEQVDSLQSAQANVEEEEEFFESGVTEQKTETEQVMETEMEVETTFVITGIVKNPGRSVEEIISLQEAIDTGIIDPDRGLYVDRVKFRKIPIPEAMNEGFIKMGPKQEKKSEEKVKSAGIVTVRTTRETRPYTVIQAINTRTGHMVPAQAAVVRGILNPENNTFKDLEKGNVMLIGDAVKHNYVEIEYDPVDTKSQSTNKPGKRAIMLEEVTVTYLVHAVVCQKTKTKIPFHEAVQKGIIDRDTGAYIDNVTGDKHFVVDAIEKGFVKATVSDKPPSLKIEQLGNMAVNERFDKMRKRVLNPLKALKAMNVNNGNTNNSNNNDNRAVDDAKETTRTTPTRVTTNRVTTTVTTNQVVSPRGTPPRSSSLRTHRNGF